MSRSLFMHMLRSGGRWKACPAVYGPSTTTRPRRPTPSCPGFTKAIENGLVDMNNSSFKARITELTPIRDLGNGRC